MNEDDILERLTASLMSLGIAAADAIQGRDNDDDDDDG